MSLSVCEKSQKILNSILKSSTIYPEFLLVYISFRFSCLPPSSHLHPGRLLPSSDGVVLEGELVLSDDGSAVFVSDVRHHVHVGGPHLKLSLPVDDGGERSADQERPLGVALKVERERESVKYVALTTGQ